VTPPSDLACSKTFV